MTRVSRILASLAAMAIIAASTSVQAECADCNCCDPGCRKVCRKICDMVEVEVRCWSCRGEDFCLADCPDIKRERPCDECTGGDGCCTDGCCTDGCCTDGACCDSGCDSGCDKGCGVKNGLFGTSLFGTGCHYESSRAQIYSRNRLGYRTVIKLVPVVRWEVVCLCDPCAQNSDCCDPADVPAGAVIEEGGQPVPADSNDVPPAPPEPTAKNKSAHGDPVASKETRTKSRVKALQAALRVWKN